MSPDPATDCIAKIDAAAFMHELGHTLGLLHGGDEKFTYEPNYLSVMNYAFAFPNTLTDRPLDYSPRANLPPLHEFSLDEPQGVLGAIPTTAVPGWNKTAFSYYNSGKDVCAYAFAELKPTDWNRDNDGVDPGVQAAIDEIDMESTSGDEDCQQPGSIGARLLTSYDDWANLDYAGGGAECCAWANL